MVREFLTTMMVLTLKVSGLMEKFMGKEFLNLLMAKNTKVSGKTGKNQAEVK